MTDEPTIESESLVEEPKRKPGGQKGNQNARTHGFYSKVLTEAQQQDFEIATEVEGIDDEIALLRVKIKTLAENNPENVKLLMHGVALLARLLMSKNNINKGDRQSITEAVGNVLKNVALPIGIGVASFFKK